MKNRDESQVWCLSGHVKQLIFSPKGGIDGLMIDVEGVPVQLNAEKHLAANCERFAAGDVVNVEGYLEPPSHKGKSAHEVYRMSALQNPKLDKSRHAEPVITGKIVRFNYAKHGEPNGFILETGDFVHTKPKGFQTLGLGVGDHVHAKGASAMLHGGHGRVIEAVEVNGCVLIEG